jgi:hypothetical protein
MAPTSEAPSSTTAMPTMHPTMMPSMVTDVPTLHPTMMPTMVTAVPTLAPSPMPSMNTEVPTLAPTHMTTIAPSTSTPSMMPTMTIAPSTSYPTMMPTSTVAPSSSYPTMMPTSTVAPSSSYPTMMPTMTTVAPSTDYPTMMPSYTTVAPSTDYPTMMPTYTVAPSTSYPSMMPTMTVPSMMPTMTVAPSTSYPSMMPTMTVGPSSYPSMMPSYMPSMTMAPSMMPTHMPTMTMAPSMMPTQMPTSTMAPSMMPTSMPTSTMAPSMMPTSMPTSTMAPSMMPTSMPTYDYCDIIMSDASDCFAGTYWIGEKCKNCAPGSYSSSDGATECTKCEVGRFVDFSGATYCYECESATSEGAKSCNNDVVVVDDNRTYVCGTDETHFNASGTTEAGDDLQFSGSFDNNMPVFEMRYTPAGFIGELGMKIRLGDVFEYTENGSHAGFQPDEDTIESRMENIVWMPYEYVNTEYGYSYAWFQSSDGKFWIYQYVSNWAYNYDDYTVFSPSQMYIAMYVSDYDYVKAHTNLAIAINIVNAESFDAEFSDYSQQLARVTSTNAAVSGYEAMVWWYSYAWIHDCDYFYNTTVTVSQELETVYLAIESEYHVRDAYFGAFIGVQKTIDGADSSTTDSTDSQISIFDSATSAGLSMVVAILIRMLLFV